MVHFRRSAVFFFQFNIFEMWCGAYVHFAQRAMALETVQSQTSIALKLSTGSFPPIKKQWYQDEHEISNNPSILYI